MEEYVLLIISAEEQKKKRKEKIERRRYLRHLREANDPFSMCDEIFLQNFRMSKSLCRRLMNDVMPYDVQKTSLSFTARFLSTLYFLGHGSYQKCIGNHCLLPMSQPSVSRSIHEMVKLIISTKSNEIKFPISLEEKIKIKSGFYAKFGIKGTVGAIDCTHIAIAAPKSTAEAPLSLYMNRKGFYSVNVEAICDHRLLFTSINAKFPGSCHDSGIWTTSLVRSHLICSHNSQSDTWLLGDQGYPLEPWLLTPLAEAHGAQEIKYNKLHAKARNVIERAFGVLKSRFRCLSKHRVLHYSHEKAANIVLSAAILHNIIIKSGEIHDFTDEFVSESSDQEIAPQSSGNCRGDLTRRRYITTL